MGMQSWGVILGVLSVLGMLLVCTFCAWCAAVIEMSERLMIVIPLYGVFMETLGRKFAMNVACSVFALGTISCALSTNMYMLIASRALAGVCPPESLHDLHERH